MDVEPLEKPIVRCFVSYPVTETLFTAPACVSLETAAYLRERGWLVVGPDPADMQALQEFERTKRWRQVWGRE